MNENKPAPETPVFVNRWVRRLRVAGALVLLLGLGGAGAVYWEGTRAGDAPEDESMIGFSKRETRQMEMMYGTQGLLMENVKEDLQQPGNQALLIVAAAAMLGVGCFYLAGRWAEGGDPGGGMKPG